MLTAQLIDGPQGVHLKTLYHVSSKGGDIVARPHTSLQILWQGHKEQPH